MTSLHIRDVPDETLATLRARAASEGQSLQAYARSLLIAEASVLSAKEAARRAHDIGSRTDITEQDILHARDAGRLAQV